MGGSSPQICRSRSPWHRSAARRSIENDSKGFSQSGTWFFPANDTSLDPNPKVTVRRAGSTASSDSESAKGAFPCVSAAAYAVSSRSQRTASAALIPGPSVNAMKCAYACAGVSTPD